MTFCSKGSGVRVHVLCLNPVTPASDPRGRKLPGSHYLNASCTCGLLVARTALAREPIPGLQVKFLSGQLLLMIEVPRDFIDAYTHCTAKNPMVLVYIVYLRASRIYIINSSLVGGL